MFIRIARYAFVLTMLVVGACSQIPSNPPPASVSKAEASTEIPAGSLSTPSLHSGRIDDAAKILLSNRSWPNPAGTR